jgi:hypothetical protein
MQAILFSESGCQLTVQTARRSPRSVAVDEIQQKIGLPPVTADLRACRNHWWLRSATTHPDNHQLGSFGQGRLSW